MIKKKIAGVERPYTTEDLGRILYDFIKDEDWENKACLDYYIPEHNDVKEILKSNFHIYSITDFGFCEGIYTDFYLEDYDKKERLHLLTAKTLHESEEAFVKMHEMAAYICFKLRLFVEDNQDNFVWVGFDVSYVKSDEEIPYCWCDSMERVVDVANELHNRHGIEKIYYEEKSTRQKFEYNL